VYGVHALGLMLVHESEGTLAAIVGFRIESASILNVVVVDHSAVWTRNGHRHADEESTMTRKKVLMFDIVRGWF
jgi:hypothetical protein